MGPGSLLSPGAPGLPRAPGDLILGPGAPGDRIFGPWGPGGIFGDFSKNLIFLKIGQNRVLGRVWADLDSGFEFSAKIRV